MSVQEWPVVFECGAEALIGVLHAPDGPANRMGVLVVVGGPQYRVGSHRQFVLMARAFADAGFCVLRFDHRGIGDSGGEARGFEALDADIAAAIDVLLRARPELQGVVLWGLCDAASACLMYRAHDARVRGMIVANPWVRTEASEARAYVRHYYPRRLLQPAFWRKVLAGRFDPWGSLRALFSALKDALRARGPQGGTAPPFVNRMLQGLRRRDIPILLLLSDNDLTAREFADQCAAARDWRDSIARPSITLRRVENADHTFSTREALDRATSDCIEWLMRTRSGG